MCLSLKETCAHIIIILHCAGVTAATFHFQHSWRGMSSTPEATDSAQPRPNATAHEAAGRERALKTVQQASASGLRPGVTAV